MSNNFKKLNNILINHYDCFNRERFYLDELEEDYISVRTSSISDNSQFNLCKNIAIFIYRKALKMGLNPKSVFVAAWCFDENFFRIMGITE